MPRPGSRCWFKVCGALLATLVAGGAQAQVITRVELDNDAFNFWQPPARRADREYTQGTRVGVMWPGHSRLARRLAGAAQACEDGPAFDCRFTTVALQQLIYTPTLSAVRRVAGERPFAGWLGAEAGVRREHARGMSAFTVTVGVTGPASLAESAQKAVHGFFGFQKPQGWERQLPTEATIMLGYRGARDVVHARAGQVHAVLTPGWEVRAGTVFTDATAALQAVIGINPSLPWRHAVRDAARRPGAYLVAGVRESGIVRNVFLDGSTFASSAHVPRHRFNGATELGVGLRGARVAVEWRVHSQGREYAGQPLAHAYSTFAFTLR